MSNPRGKFWFRKVESDGNGKWAPRAGASGESERDPDPGHSSFLGERERSVRQSPG